MHTARLLTIVFAVLALVVVFLMLRSGRLREKYALLWFGLGVITLVLAVFPSALYGAASLVGVQVPANLIFAVSIVLLGGVAIHLSWELSVLEGETRTLSEEVALLHAEVTALRDEVRAGAAPDGAADGRLDGTDGAVAGGAANGGPSDGGSPAGGTPRARWTGGDRMPGAAPREDLPPVAG